MLTVEVYKQDRRVRTGERLVRKTDHTTSDRGALEHVYSTTWLARDGYRFEIHETFVLRKSAMDGTVFTERYDTPYHCSPSSEAFWSN